MGLRLRGNGVLGRGDGSGATHMLAGGVAGQVAAFGPLAEDGVVAGGDLGEVPGWAAAVRTVAVLTGAGISTDSGIPDFRGPQGLWTRDPGAERLSSFQTYVADPAVRRRSWQARLEHRAWSATPNAAHNALARLGATIDTWVITQNIDGLHLRAGTPADRVLELHGTMYQVVCVGCSARTEMAATLDRVRAGEDDPPCERCGGILKSATVMFGQSLDPSVLGRAVRAAAGCDLMLAVGTTLTVEPAASLCAVATDAGAHLVIVNRDPTPYDMLATEVISDPIGEAIPRITETLLKSRGSRSQH
jgi:NAD-dependent deacetylase